MSLRRALREMGQEIQRQGRLGSYELASALFNGHAYRGDLGLYSAAPPQQPAQQPQQSPQQQPRQPQRGMDRG